MNDANRTYKNRQYKTHINLNKSFKSIEINNKVETLRGGIKTKAVEKKHLGWVKNDEKKLKKVYVQNSQMGIPLVGRTKKMSQPMFSLAGPATGLHFGKNLP